jgi:hypothetical protein
VGMKDMYSCKDYHIRFHAHYHGLTSACSERAWTSTQQ